MVLISNMYVTEPAGWERHVFSVDISGMGELEMQHTTYDCASWNDIERIVTYLSFAHGRPVLAYQVRDILIALNYLKTRPEVDPDRIVLAGRGLGAVAAMFAGVLAKEQVEKVVVAEPLAAYQCLTESFPNTWDNMPIVPEVLCYMDLPDLLADLGKKAVCIHPCDEMRKPLKESVMFTYYGEAMDAGAKVHVYGDVSELLIDACKA